MEGYLKLQNPQAKHKNLLKKEINLPVPVDSFSEEWPTFFGIFNGYNVIVENIGDIYTLYNKGYFGKGSLSRGYPSYESSSRDKIFTSRQCHCRKRKGLEQISFNLDRNESLKTSKQCRFDSDIELTNDSNSIEDITNDKNISSKPTINNYSVDNCILMNDSDEEKIDSNEKSKPTKLSETLCLTLEESFFLTYCLGCLKIKDIFTDKELTLNEQWSLFSKSDDCFIENYICYHYFRSKGWIVKSGINFGCEFALYKTGPSEYHASCLVKIQNINCPGKSVLKWDQLMGYTRISESAKKDFVICEITWPDKVNANKIIEDIRKFTVSQKMLLRWTAAEHR